MISRQMPTMTQRMRCLRKPRGVPQPIKIFLSETSWLRSQICLQTKRLDSKMNTMYELFFFNIITFSNYIMYFIVEFLLRNCITLSNYTLDLSHYWQDIPRGELHPCTEAKKPENKVKNRYTTIFPCMHLTKIHNKWVNLIFNNIKATTFLLKCCICRWSLASYS